jgi:catechol 2,3-dioxygenase-like lactoylglutathione lyase family enzyme
MKVTGFHHLTLTVTDVDASAAWYQELLGPAEVVQREGPDWVRIRLAWPTGIVIGLTRHDTTSGDAGFDHTRVGLDHIGLGCATEADIRDWAARLEQLGLEHGPVEDVPYGWAVTTRDPDGIAVEFFCSRAA